MMIDENDPALDRAVGSRAQRIEAVEIDDLASDALRAGRAAVPESGHRQLLRKGHDDLGTLRAAGPDRHREWLDMNIREAKSLKFGDRPGPRALLGLRGGKALANLGGQAFSDVPGIMIVAQRLIAQRGDVDGNECWRGQGGDRLPPGGWPG